MSTSPSPAITLTRYISRFCTSPSSCVFELRPEGVTLTEIAPGIDLQTQILDQMEFVPKMADEIKTMDARIFRDELMGLAND